VAYRIKGAIFVFWTSTIAVLWGLHFKIRTRGVERNPDFGFRNPVLHLRQT